VAHAEQIKAEALALLMLGNTPRYVSKMTGVPLTTARPEPPKPKDNAATRYIAMAYKRS
jgi:hypothetical protein